MPDLTRPLARVSALVAVFLVTVMLAWGKEFLMPLALAILGTFLLTPLVVAMERRRFPRVAAVILAVLLAFSVFGAALYVFTDQLLDLANELPRYKENLRAKLAVFREASNGPLSRAISTLTDLGAEMSPPPAPPTTPQGSAVPVQVVSEKPSLLSLAKTFVGPVLKPLGTAAIVIVYVIFMLLGRTDLRDRLIHLIGKGRLHVTTEAIDDAASRVSRYLGAQLFVNVTYGIPVAIGLAIIGIPNAPLWGLIAVIFRFVPYLGPMIAAAFPIALSFAVSPGWGVPIATISLFVVLELISNNVIEPWVYGDSTGLSPTAVIVSAVFWTWLWDTPGLLLATPMTVCAAVLGKYVPGLGWLDVLLSDRPPIRPDDRFYQRVLAADIIDLNEIIQEYTDEGKEAELFEEVILPTVRLIESEHERGRCDREERSELLQRIREAVQSIQVDVPAITDEHACAVLVPARSEADEVAAQLLSILLSHQGVSNRVLSHHTLNNELAAHIHEARAIPPCLVALTPTAVRTAVGLRRRVGASERRPILGCFAEHAPSVDLSGFEVIRSLRATAARIAQCAPSRPDAPAA